MKLKALIVALLLLLAATPAQAAYTFVNHAEAGLGTNGGTTSAVNMSGADLLVCNGSWYAGGGGANTITITDSATNTYTSLTARDDGVVVNRSQLWYVQGIGIGTSSHTFTLTASSSFSSIACLGFSGSVASPLDQQSGSGGTTGSPRTPGSLTPAENDSLVVTGFGSDSNTDFAVASMDGSYTVAYNGGVSMGIGISYDIQTTATASNPSWSWTAGNDRTTATQAIFKSGGGGSPSPTVKRLLTLGAGD